MNIEKILLIEDDKGTRQALTILLELNEITTTCAEGPEQAIKLLETESFRLILCALNAAQAGETNLLYYVKNNLKHYKTPVVILASEGEESTVRLALAMGAEDYILKPISGKSFISTIKSRLEIKKKYDDFLTSEINAQVFSLLNKNFNQEILTPLNGIMNATVLLETLEGTESIDGYNELLNVIHVSSFRMQRTTQNLSTYALLHTELSEGQVLSADGIILHDILMLIAGNYENRFSHGQKKLDISIVQDGSWHGPEEFAKIIFTELIDNAIKFSNQAYLPVVKLEAFKGSFNFSVTNSLKESINFNAEAISPFKKFHNDLSRNGLGLGLFIVKAICEKMGYTFAMIPDGRNITFSVEANEPLI